MSLLWTDTYEIAYQLVDKHSDIDPINISFVNLHHYVTQLDDFTDEANKSNEKILEAIQAAWIEELESVKS
jgi:FeS assembly protein IscX